MIVRQSTVEPAPTERGASRPAASKFDEGGSPNAFPSPFPGGGIAFLRVIEACLRLFKAIQSYLRVLLKKIYLKCVPACRQPSPNNGPVYARNRMPEAGKPVRCCKPMQGFANLCKHFFKNHFSASRRAAAPTCPPKAWRRRKSRLAGRRRVAARGPVFRLKPSTLNLKPYSSASLCQPLPATPGGGA